VTRLAWLLITLIVLGGVATVLAWPRLESEPPEIAITDGFDPTHPLYLGAEDSVEAHVTIADAGQGVRTFEALIEAGGASKSLVQQVYPGDVLFGATRLVGVETADIQLNAADLGLPDGEATLVLRATDFSVRTNTTEQRIELRIDTRPPKIRADLPPQIPRGGAGLARYRVDELTAIDGVFVGDVLFRGFPEHPDASERIAYFTIPVDSPVGAKIGVMAQDLAGNTTTVRSEIRVQEKSFGEENLDLSDEFLARVADRFSDVKGVDASDSLAAFRYVNEKLRVQNEQKIRATLDAGASAERLWTGSFQQMPGSKVMSRFAERRHYKVRGQEVSVVRHYGFDLASTRQAPILASNAGRVVYADALGIYGNCVLVDHGQGLASLYGHLSSIDVSVGQPVARGDVLGHSGATGLAGGDHLHFAILVNGEYVDPIEWWDPKWIETRIDARWPE